MCQNFLFKTIIPLYIYIHYIVYASVNGHLSFLHFLALMNNSILNMVVNSKLYQSIFNILCIFDSLNQGLANYGPQAKSGLMSVFIDKILLKRSHAQLFTYHLRLFSYYITE